MALPTAKDITNMYLYGQLNTPTDLTSLSIIRLQTDTTFIEIDRLEFMTSVNGGGRFAIGAQFEIIQKFFTA